MNATSPNPYFAPNNVCKCGHNIASHVNVGVDTTQTNCNECIPRVLTPANPNKHIFEAMMAEGPLPPAGSFFLCAAQKGYINPGGLGFSFTRTVILAATQGAPQIQLNSTAGIIPGMSFFTQPTNLGNTATYTVLGVKAASIVLDRPLNLNINSGTIIIFDGTHESSMGPARPSRNYQRMG
jgi:hypothetical protein